MFREKWTMHREAIWLDLYKTTAQYIVAYTLDNNQEDSKHGIVSTYTQPQFHA